MLRAVTSLRLSRDLSDMLTVLLATDGSESVLQAAATAARLLQPHAPVQVTVLYVRPSASIPMLGTGIGPTEDARLEGYLHEAEQSVLDQTAEALRVPGFDVRLRLEVGPPAQTIVLIVEQENYDLLVMGRGRQGELQTLLLGSVGAEVLRSVRVPILLA